MKHNNQENNHTSNDNIIETGNINGSSSADKRNSVKGNNAIECLVLLPSYQELLNENNRMKEVDQRNENLILKNEILVSIKRKLELNILSGRELKSEIQELQNEKDVLEEENQKLMKENSLLKSKNGKLLKEVEKYEKQGNLYQKCDESDVIITGLVSENIYFANSTVNMKSNNSQNRNPLQR